MSPTFGLSPLPLPRPHSRARSQIAGVLSVLADAENTFSAEDFARERVFSCVERGEFYMIGDNPARFNIKEMIRHRMEGILSMAPPVPYWSAGSRFDPRVSEIGGVQQAAAERAARAVVEAEATVSGS